MHIEPANVVLTSNDLRIILTWAYVAENERNHDDDEAALYERLRAIFGK